MDLSWSSIAIIALSFVIAFYLYHLTSLDLIIQDYLYNFQTKQWLINRREPTLRWIFYSAPKRALITFAAINLVLFALSYKIKSLAHNRWAFLYVTLCLTIVPIIISLLKDVTAVDCPWDLTRYGGYATYVKPLQSYPEPMIPIKIGKCFPGGHASGGFALFSLFFISRKRLYKIIGFLIPIVCGGILSVYQMLKGAHFLSHNIATLFIAWTLCSILYKLAFYLERRFVLQ
jgi:membrane-associated PAP2 superfamily phosphatase